MPVYSPESTAESAPIVESTTAAVATLARTRSRVAEKRNSRSQREAGGASSA